MADNPPNFSTSDGINQTTTQSSTGTTTYTTRVTPTDDSMLALTTPFVQPPGCASIWEPTIVKTFDAKGSSLTLTILASDAANPRFTSCQPKGWATNIPARDFSFSPAVCPSGWTYWGMTETFLSNVATYSDGLYSTAICCDSGYSPWPSWSAVSSVAEPCIRSFGPTDSITVVTAGTRGSGERTITSGVLMHDAWQISWRSDDRSTMSPPLPTLTSGKNLKSWVPGQTVAPGEGDQPGAGVHEVDHSWDGMRRFLMIGLPIILVVLIASIVYCCYGVFVGRKTRSMNNPVVLESVLRK